MLNGSIANRTNADSLTEVNKISERSKFFFFLLPIFKFNILESYPMLDMFYSLWGAFSLFLLIVIGLRQNNKEKKSLIYTTLLITFCAIYCIMTKIYTPSIFLGSISRSVRLLLFPYYLLVYRDTDLSELLHSLSKFLKVILFLDQVSIFIDYDEKIQYSLLGLDNTAIFIIIPALAIILFNDYYRNKRISRSSVVLLVICYIGKLYSQAVTSIIAMTIFILAVLMTLSSRKKALITALGILIDPTVMFGTFIVFTLMTLLFDITPLISAIFSPFGKSGTMNGRTKIWALTVDSILRDPLIGYGQASPGYFQNIIGLPQWAKAATHPHNYLLELLWSTGIIGTVIYMYIFINAVKKLYQYRNIKAARLLSCGITGFSVLMITDSYIMQPTIMILCFLCLNIDKIMMQNRAVNSTGCGSS